MALKAMIKCRMELELSTRTEAFCGQEKFAWQRRSNTDPKGIRVGLDPLAPGRAISFGAVTAAVEILEIHR